MSYSHYQRILRRVLSATLSVLFCLLALPQVVHSQAPEPDSYEDNDTLVAASSLPATVTLPNMTIVPAQDPDFWRVVANSGPLTAQVFGTPGLDLTLNLYDPSGALIATDNDPAGPNARVSVTAPATGYYVFEVTSTTLIEGFYELRVNNVPPTPTPTPTSTATPSYTATPEMGGAPDFAEPNWDFAYSYRIVPGDVLKGLNFNPGTAGAKDNDFFVMAVRGGVRYTCRTEELGSAVDTNLIVYSSPDQNAVIGGNDDVDTQAGLVNSQLNFVAPADGDVYLLVGYKFPFVVDIRYPGQASYTFSCAAASLPTPTPAPAANAATGGWAPANTTPQATPLAIALFSRPTLLPSPTSAPVGMLTVSILIGYDRNENKEIDPNESVVGLSVRVIDAASNTQLAGGFTDMSGSVSFTIPTNNDIQVVVPFLAMARDFRPGSDAGWVILIPPANVPALIP